jgi:hypothetical protein
MRPYRARKLKYLHFLIFFGARTITETGLRAQQKLRAKEQSNQNDVP